MAKHRVQIRTRAAGEQAYFQIAGVGVRLRKSAAKKQAAANNQQ
jgi:hypothetical protein